MTDKDKEPDMCHARSPSGNRTPPRRPTPTPASDDNTRMSSDQIEDEASVMAEEMVSKLTQDQIRDLAEALQKDLASEKTKTENPEVSEESETSKASDAAIIDPSWILDNSGGPDVTAGDDDVYVSPEDRFTVNELKLKMEKSADKKKFVSSTADKGLLALEHDYCDAEKKLAKDESKVTEAKRVLRSSTRPTKTRKEEKNRKEETENKEEDIDIDGEDKAENDDKVVEKTKREEEEHEDDKDKGKSDKESEKGKDDDEEEEEEDDDEEEEEEDNSLYCICRKPHQNRFMICCDRCQEWYHGDCVGISVERGQEMDMNDEEYVCPKCQRKAKDRKLLREKAMQSKKRELEKRSGKHELRRRDAPVLETVQSEMRNQKALTRTRIGGRRLTLADYEEDDEWVPWRPQPQDEEEEVSQEKKSKSTSSSSSSSSRICLNPTCKKLCRGDTLYCSEECIKKYARSALNQLAQIAAHQKSTSFSAQVAATGPAADRVTVFDRSAGRSVGGMAAPKRENLASWLVSHPMCEVAFKSGSGMGGQSQKDSKPKESRLSRSDSLSDDRKPKMSMNVKLVRNNVVKSLKQILLERQKADRVKVDEKDVQLISQKIEKQLYRIHDGVGQKYKAKYRTLMFNLKDTKNSVLYKDVLAGRLKPSEIVTLSSEELASKELAKWRQEENKKTLELIKAAELEAAKEKIKITKMTHKGEIEIEEINLGKSTSEPTPAPSVVDVLSVDTTAQHQSHVFSVNCRICTGKEEAPRIVKKKNDKPNDRERKNERDRQIEEKPQPDYDVMDVDVNPPSPLPLVPPELPEWKGVVNMQGVAKFIATAYVVSGSISKKALSAMLPDSCSVQGRIAAGQVWDYVKKLKYSTNRDVCLIRFEPGSGDEKRSFLELFTYMKEKQRFVVVVNCHLPIKDMYLMPLSTGESLPNFLKPFHGPGLPRDRSDLIIGIIVKQSSKQRRHHGNSGTSSRESHRHHHQQQQHQHQCRSKSSRKHHHHHQTVPDEAPINLAKKGYFQVSSSPSSSSTAALGRNSPPADVRYSPSAEVYSPSQPSLDDDVPSGQTESTTKPSSAVSAILSVAMARAGGGGGLSAATTNRTEIPLLGGDSTSSGGTSIPLLGDTTSVRLPAQTASSSSVSVESAEPPPVFSSSLMQAVKAMSSDTLQNIAQAVGFMKNQNPTPLEDPKRSPQQLTASSDNSPPPQLPPAPLPHRSPPLEHMPDSISYESRPSDPRQKSAPISAAVSDPRRPPNWETDSPPPQQPRKRTRWDDNDEERLVGGGTITKATRWEDDKEPLQPPPQPLLQPRRSRWEPQEELVPPPPPPPPLSRSGLLPLPPEDQRLDRGDLGYEFEMERRFDPPSDVAQQPPLPPPAAAAAQFRDVDPRFDDMGGVRSFPPAAEERVDPSLYMQPTEEAMMRGEMERYPPGERERRLMPEGRLDWDREAEERRRYEEEEESKWEDPADESRRSKMPKEMREYIEATKRELRESTVVDQDRERRGLPLGYQSARRELEERKDRGHSHYREGDRYGGDPRWEREGYYRDEGRPRRP